MSQRCFGGAVVGIMATALLLASATAGAATVTFTGHTGYVNSVAFSPDGTKVLTGAAYPDDTAKLWNATTGTVIRTFTGHTQSVNAVAFSSDGAQVLTGSNDNTAKLWNASTGTLVRTFTGHASAVFAVAISPDGTKVLTGSSDNTAKLWNASTGAVLHTFTGYLDLVSGVAFSPDGTRLITGARDVTVTLWNTSTYALVHTFYATSAVSAVAFSPDGTQVLAAAGVDTAVLWSVSTGALLHTFTGHTDTVNAVAFSPNGKYVLTGSDDKTVKLWNASTAVALQTFTEHTQHVESVAFSPGGDEVLSGADDTTAILETIPVPKGTIVINSNRSATNNPAVTLALTWSGGWGTGVVQMRFSNDGSHWTAWEPPTATRAYSLPAGDGHKTVRVQFLDKLNNTSAVFSDYILLDTTPPTGSIFINIGAATTATQAVTLSLSWADAGSGVSRMRFSDDGAHWTAWELPKATRAYTLPLPNGYHTVRVQYLDGAGNYSPVYSDYIKLAMP